MRTSRRYLVDLDNFRAAFSPRKNIGVVLVWADNNSNSSAARDDVGYTKKRDKGIDPGQSPPNR